MNRLGCFSLISILWLASCWQGSTQEPKPEATVDGIGPIVYSPDGKLLACLGYEKHVLIWDLPTRKMKAKLPNAQERSSLSFSHDGKALAIAVGKEVKLWEVATGKVTQTFKVSDDVLCVALSPNGKLLVSGSWDSNQPLVTWDVETGKETQPILLGHSERVGCLAFTLDGKTLASGSGDKTVRVYDMASGKATKFDIGFRVHCLAFSSEGEKLVVVGENKYAWLWDVKEGKPTAVFKGHEFAASHAALSPDGKVLATAGGDGVRLWNIATKKEIGFVRGPAGDLAFSPSGKTLAVVTYQRAAKGFDPTGIKLWTVESLTNR